MPNDISRERLEQELSSRGFRKRGYGYELPAPHAHALVNVPAKRTNLETLAGYLNAESRHRSWCDLTRIEPCVACFAVVD